MTDPTFTNSSPYGQVPVNAPVSAPLGNVNGVITDSDMRKHELADLLHQILAINDQSLDEAQAR